MSTETEWAYLALLGTAIVVALFFNRQSAPQWLVLKLIGVIASTIPIIGILQGGMFLEKDPPHSRACFVQAFLAIAAYFVLLHGFRIDLLTF